MDVEEECSSEFYKGDNAEYDNNEDVRGKSYVSKD